MCSRRGSGVAGLLAALVMVCLGAAGCQSESAARLWADTALPDGTLSTRSHQWAYDGEPVTFELEVPPGSAHYAVFGVGGDDTVVNTAEVEGRYRWTHVFHAGAKPQTFEVHAAPFLIRGKCDWIYESRTDKWTFYPGRSDKPDTLTAEERTMDITCYRVEVKMPFTARGGRPLHVRLALIKADGQRVEVPQADLGRKAEDAQPGFLLQEFPNGSCEVAYTPPFNEVSRSGKTLAELIVQHADGTIERLKQELDTP
jgi:hypothetical protein